MMVHKCCNKQKVKRGLWSPEEDEKLMNHINTYGHGSWSSIPKLAGLERCGKSCRLRWINYLRPDVKRGEFSELEKQTIIDIHRILGNKWAQIAKHLPGRTDNEVKNLWNSCIKKRLIAQGFDPNTHNLLPCSKTNQTRNFKGNNSTDDIACSNIFSPIFSLPKVSYLGHSLHQSSSSTFSSSTCQFPNASVVWNPNFPVEPVSEFGINEDWRWGGGSFEPAKQEEMLMEISRQEEEKGGCDDDQVEVGKGNNGLMGGDDIDRRDTYINPNQRQWLQSQHSKLRNLQNIPDLFQGKPAQQAQLSSMENSPDISRCHSNDTPVQC